MFLKKLYYFYKLLIHYYFILLFYVKLRISKIIIFILNISFLTILGVGILDELAIQIKI